MKYYILLLSLLISSTLSLAQQVNNPSAQLKKLGIELPEPSKPIANYVKYVKTGNLIFLSGHGPCDRTKVKMGKLGKDLTIDEGYEAARQTGICLLATLNMALDGDLSKVKRIVRVIGMVNSADEFYDQPKVINGCSDLMVEVFGDKGKHARAAVGMASLPSNIPVEIEMIVEVED